MPNNDPGIDTADEEKKNQVRQQTIKQAELQRNEALKDTGLQKKVLNDTLLARLRALFRIGRDEHTARRHAQKKLKEDFFSKIFRRLRGRRNLRLLAMLRELLKERPPENIVSMVSTKKQDTEGKPVFARPKVAEEKKAESEGKPQRVLGFSRFFRKSASKKNKLTDENTPMPSKRSRLPRPTPPK